MFTRRCPALGAVVVALLLALAGHAEAVPSGRNALEKRVTYDVNLNSFIDANIDGIRSLLSDIDPLAVEDVKYPLTTHIYMKLSSGWLQNLSHLQRSGNCSVRYTKPVLTFDFNFSWDEIAIDYTYLLQILLLKRGGDVHGELEDLKIHVEVDFNFETYEVTLQELEFTDTDKITIKLEGHLTDFIYNIMINTVTWLFRDLILAIIESQVVNMIESTIEDVNFLVGNNQNRMSQLIKFVIPFDYENGSDYPTSFDRFLLEKH